jgi:hypothetical protein
MPESQNNHITIMLQNENIVIRDMIPCSVVELCNVSEEPATSIFSFKGLDVLKLSHFYAPFNLLTNFYINVFVSMLACLNLLTKKLKLHCFKLLSTRVILYNERVFLSIIFHASTMHCRSMHVLLAAALD